MLFTFAWSIVKAMLDERTASKIKIMGSSYQKELLKDIASENLSVSLGGTCKDAVGDVGPWNDGSVPGFPVAFWEDFRKRDGF